MCKIVFDKLKIDFSLTKIYQKAAALNYVS